MSETTKSTMTPEDLEPPDKQPAPPAYHYLGALVITGIVTGLAFLIKDPASKWVVFGVAVAMDLGVILVALMSATKNPDS
ncbi:MAG TPA: hypothetical protein VG184_03125 [Acidimicrobiales bacterium]|jgi:hypothetical protein|nr:hypothetical protein [Acidimicrobiales bacterium]